MCYYNSLLTFLWLRNVSIIWRAIYFMFLNPSLTLYFKMFISTKTGIGALKQLNCVLTIFNNNNYDKYRTKSFIENICFRRDDHPWPTAVRLPLGRYHVLCDPLDLERPGVLRRWSTGHQSGHTLRCPGNTQPRRGRGYQVTILCLRNIQL